MKTIQSKNAPEAIGPYSQAIETNHCLYISGQIPLNPETGMLEAEDIEIQTKRVLSNLEAILTEAGYSKNNVVKTTCLLQDMSYFEEMNAIYADFFGDHKPARACFAVKALPKNALIEIEAIACKND